MRKGLAATHAGRVVVAEGALECTGIGTYDRIPMQTLRVSDGSFQRLIDHLFAEARSRFTQAGPLDMATSDADVAASVARDVALPIMLAGHHLLLAAETMINNGTASDELVTAALEVRSTYP